MRVVIQRVSKASVRVGDSVVAPSTKDFASWWVEDADTYDDADWLAAKIAKLRIFNDPKENERRPCRCR